MLLIVFNQSSAGGVSPPLAPSALIATSAGANQINLTWTDNSSDEDGFKIERSLDGVVFAQIDTVGPGTTTYSSASLSAATTYYYRVRAFNGVGNSDYSNTANATTASGHGSGGGYSPEIDEFKDDDYADDYDRYDEQPQFDDEDEEIAVMLLTMT